MRRIHIVTIIATSALLLVVGCSDSTPNAIGDGPCALAPNDPANYETCTTPEQRQQDLDDARTTAQNNNLLAQDPAAGMRLHCGTPCRPQSYCPQVLQACNAADAANADPQTCIWRVAYDTGDGHSTSASGADGQLRHPVALCDCDYTTDERDAWCSGQTPDNF